MAKGLLFSGQGAQSVGMAKTLFDESAAVKALFEQANSVLGFDLAKLCFEGPNEELTKTSVCQPALYVHGCSVLALLKEKGLIETPAVCLGLSLGELTALAAAGAFDFATGLKLVAERGRLMQEACEATSGTMASVIGGEEADVAKLCEEFDIEIANLNCPGQIVISGEKDKVLAAVEKATSEKLFRMVKPLNVAGAYHSRLMQPACDAFAKVLADADIQKPAVPVFTNTTGKTVENPDDIRAALTKQVVSSVRWTDCMQGAIALGVTEYYECGPGAVLTGLAKRIDRAAKVTPIAEMGDFPEA